MAKTGALEEWQFFAETKILAAGLLEEGEEIVCVIMP
jgi:hypothetical protein